MRALHILASIREHSCLFVAERPQPQNPLASGKINATTPPRRGATVELSPALKSRAKLTRSLPRPGKRWLHYFFKDHQSVPLLTRLAGESGFAQPPTPFWSLR